MNSLPWAPRTVIVSRTHQGFGFTLRHFIVYPPDTDSQQVNKLKNVIWIKFECFFGAPQIDNLIFRVEIYESKFFKISNLSPRILSWEIILLSHGHEGNQF